MQIPDGKLEPEEIAESLTPDPPPYYEANTSVPFVNPHEPVSNDMITQLHSRFISRPTNFVTIFERNSGVKGSWTIDTSLTPPAALLAPMLEPSGIRPNVRLASQNGAINASIRLVGEHKDRAILDCSTQNGNVHLALVSRGPQNVAIKLHSQNGSIKVFLPRDFCGPIDHSTRNGAITFSPEVKSCMMPISSSYGIGRSFVGDIHSIRPDDLASPNAVVSNSFSVVPVWGGDSLEADTANGSIHFAFVDEPSYITTLLKLFFGS